MSGSANVINGDLQEKGVISTDGNLCLTPKGSQESNFLEKYIPIEMKKLEHNEDMNLVPKMDVKNVQSLQPKEEEVRHELNSLGDLIFEQDPRVYDVHVVGDGISFRDHENINKSEKLSLGSLSEVNNEHSIPFEAPVMKSVDITDFQGTSGSHAEVNVKRSNSDRYHRLPPVIPRGTSTLSDLQRNSMSMVDSGMFNIDSEVGQLLERLLNVKEEREKLSISLENRERGNLQLKRLEDTASQVQQIRHLAEPGKAVRHVSFPHPNY